MYKNLKKVVRPDKSWYETSWATFFKLTKKKWVPQNFPQTIAIRRSKLVNEARLGSTQKNAGTGLRALRNRGSVGNGTAATRKRCIEAARLRSGDRTTGQRDCKTTRGRSGVGRSSPRTSGARTVRTFLGKGRRLEDDDTRNRPRIRDAGERGCGRPAGSTKRSFLWGCPRSGAPEKGERDRFLIRQLFVYRELITWITGHATGMRFSFLADKTAGQKKQRKAFFQLNHNNFAFYLSNKQN